MPTPRTVLFVCAHGAYRSRLAAAFFNAAAPTGWRAVSAGVDPQAAVSAAAIELAAGTAAEPHDRGGPGADRWDLVIGAVGPAQRDEIRARAEALAADLSAG